MLICGTYRTVKIQQICVCTCKCSSSLQGTVPGKMVMWLMISRAPKFNIFFLYHHPTCSLKFAREYLFLQTQMFAVNMDTSSLCATSAQFLPSTVPWEVFVPLHLGATLWHFCLGTCLTHSMKPSSEHWAYWCS